MTVTMFDYVAAETDFARGELNRKLIAQHTAFDPFIRAEHRGKSVRACFVRMLIKEVEAGRLSQEDLSFDPSTKITPLF